MRIWDILGIEPTNDIKDIKRAYSKLLKIYHPEDDAEGYQRLREAYDLAMKLAKRNSGDNHARTLKDAEESQREKEKREQEKREEEKRKQEKREQERLEEEKREQEKREQEKHEQEKREQEKREQEKRKEEEREEDRNETENSDEKNKINAVNQPVDEHESDLEGSDDQPNQEWEAILRDTEVESSPEDIVVEDEIEAEIEVEVEVEEEYSIPYNLRNQFYLEWNNEPDPESQLKTFLEQVNTIYSEFRCRIDKKQWMELLNSDIVWNASMKQRVSETLLEYLEEHFWLPHDIWVLFNDTFYWVENDEDRDEIFSQEFPNAYARISAKPSNLNMNYAALLRAGDIDYDTYLRYREEAYLALANNELQLAEQSLQMAAALFGDDLELVLMQIDCYRRMGDKVRTLACCNHRISIDPNTLSGYYSRALAFYDNDKPTEALRDLKLMIQLNPNNREALSLSGQCYVKLGEINKAQEVFTRILAINQNDVIANIALLKLKAQEVEKLRSSGMVETVRGLDKELGRVRFSSLVITSVILFLSHTWFSLISILVLFVLLYQGFKNIPSILSDPFADWYVWLYLSLLLFLSHRVYSSLSKEIRRTWKTFRYNR